MKEPRVFGAKCVDCQHFTVNKTYYFLGGCPHDNEAESMKSACECRFYKGNTHYVRPYADVVTKAQIKQEKENEGL